MMICDPANYSDTVDAGFERFRSLTARNILPSDMLRTAGIAADVRSVSIEHVLRHELNIPRRKLVEALADYYQCDWIEYDERTAAPPDLLAGLDADLLCGALWFPVLRNGDMVVIAANNPSDPFVMDQARRMVRAERYEFRVALTEDILFFIQDFLNGPPEHLIGNERTGLAFWRNIMSRWRTRLACYRTDFAIARTHFSSLRWGLGLITTGRVMLQLERGGHLWVAFCWTMVVAGVLLLIAGFASYFRIKRSIVRPPAPHTLIEVSAATLHFLENYQFAEKERAEEAPPRGTMLARLMELLPNSCVFIENSTDNKVRSYLAHERTALAAQRTVLACYRTIYARARTGLSFIRTGSSFIGIGTGLIEYFGFSIMTLVDVLIVLVGLLMITDGIVWYWPVRKEQREAPPMV